MTQKNSGIHTRPDEIACLENLHIAISGLIGAGKTTLCTALGKVMNLTVFYEPLTEEGYLADFYKDPKKKYSFPLQVYLLNKRFRQQQQIIWSGKGGIQDRTIYEDGVFAKMLRDSELMEERDYQTYTTLFANMSNFMKKPNVIIHLDVTPKESLKRIRMRSREWENGITLEYLTNLYNSYEIFINDISRVIPVIKVNWSQFRTAEEMAKTIKKEFVTMQNIHYVDFSKENGFGVKEVFSNKANTPNKKSTKK